MGWFTKKELVPCAACKGSGKQDRLSKISGEIDMNGRPAADVPLLIQGICLGCRGAGKIRV